MEIPIPPDTSARVLPPRRVWFLCKESQLLEGKLKSRKYGRWRERGPC